MNDRMGSSPPSSRRGDRVAVLLRLQQEIQAVLRRGDGELSPASPSTEYIKLPAQEAQIHRWGQEAVESGGYGA
jgi:hypothetical protein